MTDILLAPGVGQRAASYKFELLDNSNSYLGLLEVDASSPPSIGNNINRTVKRNLDGLVLPPSVTAEVNTLTERVRPVAIFQDGTEHELGVFIFADASRRLALYGSSVLTVAGETGMYTDGTMLDLGATLNQGSRGVTFYGPNDSIYNAIIQQLEARGITDYDVDPIDARFGNWVVWKPNESSLTILYDLCDMGGYYSLYFNNHGTARVKLVPDLEATSPDHSYDVGDTIYADTLLESDDQLDAPNVYVVVNNSFTESPVFGEWAIPAGAPHSEANRGFAVVREYDIQGVESNAEAARVAKAQGQQDYSTYRTVDVGIAIDPTHDTFEITELLGIKYREQSWGFQLWEGDEMHLELARVWYENEATAR